jgi:hypothetical protein
MGRQGIAGARRNRSSLLDHGLRRRSVVVAVEEIRPVLMGVRQAFVLVPMGMANRSRQAGMAVVVVAIVMIVDVLVAPRLMHVGVDVALHQKKR